MNGKARQRTWLEWLVKVRIIIITCLLAIELAITQLTPTNVNVRLFVGVILAWYLTSFLFIWAVSRWPDSRLQSEAQVAVDLIFATAIIYVTGGVDTSFNFLYPLIIIVASILLSEGRAYLTAGFSFVLLGAILELSCFELIHSYSTTKCDLKSLQAIILINLFAYGIIAYLANRLSGRLRQVDVALADASGALENLQALHENVVNSISGGLITTDLQGRVKLVNPAGRRLLGREGVDLEGVSVDSFFLEPLPRPGSGDPPIRTDVKARTPGGEERFFGVSISTLVVREHPESQATDHDEPRALGYVFTFNDLTEIRRLERELHMRERLAAIGRLSAGIAHEIRNPLSSITGSVKVLSTIATLTEDQRALVQIVTRESERLNAIVTDFLTYSRERKCQMLPVDLRATLEDTLTLLENRSEKVEIIRHFETPQAMTMGDADKLKQVFWNLCENALRAVTLKAEASPVTDTKGKLIVKIASSDDQWKMTFRDTGMGIPSQLREKIFEPFQSGFEGGTGLGLAIVYQIVQAHQARITVRSEQGVGTEFTLFFRKAREAEQGRS